MSDESSPIKITGTADRFNSGKLDLNYCPTSTQVAVASVFSFNSKKQGGKYDDFNWKKGQKYSIPLASAKRHLEDYINGIDIDPDSGLPSLWCAQCNLSMLIEYTLSYPEGDDRPSKQGVPTIDFRQLMDIYKKRLDERNNKENK